MIRNEFYSPVMKINSENDFGNQDEIDHLKNVIDRNTKELVKKDEELNAAQECIEIIHDKLKQILLRKFVEILQKQLNISKIHLFERMKNN